MKNSIDKNFPLKKEKISESVRSIYLKPKPRTYSSEAKKYRLLWAIAYNIVKNPEFNKINRMRVTIADLREFNYEGDYIFKDLSNEDAETLKEYIFKNKIRLAE